MSSSHENSDIPVIVLKQMEQIRKQQELYKQKIATSMKQNLQNQLNSQLINDQTKNNLINNKTIVDSVQEKSLTREEINDKIVENEIQQFEIHQEKQQPGAIQQNISQQHGFQQNDPRFSHGSSILQLKEKSPLNIQNSQPSLTMPYYFQPKVYSTIECGGGHHRNSLLYSSQHLHLPLTSHMLGSYQPRIHTDEEQIHFPSGHRLSHAQIYPSSPLAFQCSLGQIRDGCLQCSACHVQSCCNPILSTMPMVNPYRQMSWTRSMNQLNQFNLQENHTLSCNDLSETHNLSPPHYDSHHFENFAVEVTIGDEPYFGIIRWIGLDSERSMYIAGIEMEKENDSFGNGNPFFVCDPRRSFYVPLNECRKDSRFIEPEPSTSNAFQNNTENESSFGVKECPIIPGAVEPLSMNNYNIDSICGKFKGIQGHHNSCYLDATLFAMFTFTSVFDSLLFRPPRDTDSEHYTEVQNVLREGIVNPLRKNLFVRADRVMTLRHLLDTLSSVTGLTTEEKDPEEFLSSLVAQILKAEPFLKLSSGHETYHYQLFVEKDADLSFPTVQQLFDQSFLTSDINLKEIPSCLIIQMPRFGKDYKMYPKILPSQLLDITDVIEDSPRQCTVCGNLAKYECKMCFNQYQTRLQSIWYCEECLLRSHKHEQRMNHESCWKKLPLSEYTKYDGEYNKNRVLMELFAVVCIETSHYVAFVKCGSETEAPWCFFDSMADRKGEQNGYNIPEMVPCPELPLWISETTQVNDDILRNKYAKRLMCDAYMVMYQSSDAMMYR